MHLSLESGVVCGRARGAVRPCADRQPNTRMWARRTRWATGEAVRNPIHFSIARKRVHVSPPSGDMHCCRGLLHSVCQRRVLAPTIS